MRVIADTSAIIALLDEDDKHHTEVVRVAESASQSSTLVQNQVRYDIMLL
ncbi:hypothetical protein [Tumidithrix elongata]